MNKFVSLSMALTASTLTMGTLPVYAANFNDSGLDFSQMFFFGDSFSDTGNTNGANNSSRYFERRYSNGDIWIDSLASSFDLNIEAFGTNPLSLGDGVNYAKAGNGSGETGLGKQLDNFINSLSADNSPNSDALYTMWIGLADYIVNPFTETVDTTVDNVINGIEDLYNLGARNFLIPNLISVDSSPFVTSEGISDTLDELTDAHNQKLELAIAELEESLSEATITLVDFDSIFDNIVDNPTQFGFTNVTDSWLDTVLEPSACSDAFSLCSADLQTPDEYLFWDTIHPTKAFHQLIANEAISALNSEYNQTVPESTQTVPESTSTLSLLGLGLSFLGMSAFKQKDKQKQKQKV